MKNFAGFPAKMRFTPLPNLFFSALLPDIEDLAELKVTLHIFWTLYQKRGYPKYVAYGELAGDKTLMAGISHVSSSPPEALRLALEQATARGTLLHATMEGESGGEDLYFLNTGESREAIAKLKNGQLVLQGLSVKKEPYEAIEESPNIFTLYEQNIGMLTPLIAEELREAEKLYPASWVEEAFREATSLNRRSWRYIQRILERWAAEGKEDGTAGRYTKEIDRDKYIKGRYGHIVQR
ncbi:MAG: hypothetical protein A2Y60_07635 [Chloroflexi bacterium RBG_13_54_9]|nr:MAG: hypothetical protein A2Y60_07635 [Chloroflexi bacterium RBG_13_54_9]